MNWMQWGSDWLESVRDGQLSSDLTYERPGSWSLSIKATLGKQDVSYVDQSGIVIRVDTATFQMPRTAIYNGNTRRVPVVGDRIIGTLYGWRRTYEVNPINGTCFKNHDRFAKAIVVYVTMTDEVYIG